uniref:Uncharacterized protein n=1 Tax=Anopheles melas TaxID=34690 RepID=A0A182TIY7_9DIPT
MLLSWAYDGVNGSVPRNTGPECADYLSPVRKLVETMVIIPLCLIAIKCALSRIKPIAYQQMDRFTGSPFSACNKSTKSSTVLFRLQMNYLNGPLLAFMFPETDSRQLPLESSIYWIQHALMCIIPIFLLKSGGVYNMEPLNDFTWNVIGYATLILYHFGILQVIASVSLLTST